MALLILANHRDYVAVIWGRIDGMSGHAIKKVYSCDDLSTLTKLVRARGLSDDEYVRYDRNVIE
jgi:hypothetical protein